MIKISKIICLLFFLLAFIIDTNPCPNLTNIVGFFCDNKRQIFCYVLPLMYGSLPQVTYQYFCVRGSQKEKEEIKRLKLLNDRKELANKELEQEIAYNNKPEVREVKIKALAVQVVLQSDPKWINQELQKRAQEVEKENMQQRKKVLEEIIQITSLKKDGCFDNDKEYGEISSTLSNLFNKYNQQLLVQGAGSVTIKIESGDDNEDND